MLGHGFSLSKNPILKPLQTIEQRDAIMNPDGTEPEWPGADEIVGNPPFLGDKKMLGGLGADYVGRLRTLYEGRVPGGADLVTYWFEKARAQIASGALRYAGLVATNSIRGGANRKLPLARRIAIFNAWSDEPWINEGAAVRVSLVATAPEGHGRPIQINGQPARAIDADLTEKADTHSLVDARPIRSQQGISFQGPVKVGKFDIPGNLARQWLLEPNPHGRPNSDVLRPWANGLDVTRRPSDTRWRRSGCRRSHRPRGTSATPGASRTTACPRANRSANAWPT
jgi:hypothetical protein